MGDKFENISNSQVFNKSNVIGSFNKMEGHVPPDVRDALIEVGNVIDAEGNAKAVKQYEKFTKELEDPDPNKPVLKAYWEGIVEAAPAVKNLADAAGKIATLFV